MDKDILIKLAKDIYKLTLLFPKKEPLRYKIREAADDLIAGFLAKQNDHIDAMKTQIEIIDSFLEIVSVQDWAASGAVAAARDGYRRLADELGQVKPEEPAAELKEVVAAKNPLAKENIIYSPPAGGAIIPADLPATPMVAAEGTVAVAGAASAGAEESESGEDAGDGREIEEEEGGLTSSQIVRQNRIIEFLKEKGSSQVWEIQKIFPRVSKRTIRRDFRSMLKQGLIERFGERNTTFYKLKINVS